MSKIDLSIVVINYNNPLLIEKCLISIEKYLADIKKEIIVVDNNSEFENLNNHLSIYKDLKVIYLPKNMGFGYAVNVGVKNSIGQTLFILNSDAEFVDDSFKLMLREYRLLDAPQIWAPRLVWPDGKFQNSYSRKITFFDFILFYSPISFLIKIAGIRSSHRYNSIEFHYPTSVDVIYATALLVDRMHYLNLGGFSKKYFMYFEDVDFCDRFITKFNGGVIFYPSVTIKHAVKGSSNLSKINFNYLLSKYIYGFTRFGLLPMIFFAIFDLFFSPIKITISSIQNKFDS